MSTMTIPEQKNIQDSQFDLEDIENEIYFLLEIYLEENMRDYLSPHFLEKMVQDVCHFFQFSYNYLLQEESVWECMEHVLKLYQIPLRQENTFAENTFAENTFVENTFAENTFVEDDIDHPSKLYNNETTAVIIQQLSLVPQTQQRTYEWFVFRHERFSASSIWKLLSSPAQYTSLILEKSKPIDQLEMSSSIVSNYNNPRNWGIKYESLSIMIYADKHPNTKVKTDYGCIIHPAYPFIAASPDGINISPDSPEKFGRMVEVKNIYNREIDGIPLEEYWVQMQIQMETCGLDSCDFLETRFKEYNSETEFYEDEIQEYRGVILFFVAKNPEHSNQFVYMPLYVCLQQKYINAWIREKQDHYVDYFLYETIYWYLDEYSCVEVRRNHAWFESVLPIIQNAWKDVVHERKTGNKQKEKMEKKSEKLEKQKEKTEKNLEKLEKQKEKIEKKSEKSLDKNLDKNLDKKLENNLEKRKRENISIHSFFPMETDEITETTTVIKIRKLNYDM